MVDLPSSLKLHKVNSVPPVCKVGLNSIPHFMRSTEKLCKFEAPWIWNWNRSSRQSQWMPAINNQLAGCALPGLHQLGLIYHGILCRLSWQFLSCSDFVASHLFLFPFLVFIGLISHFSSFLLLGAKLTSFLLSLHLPCHFHMNHMENSWLRLLSGDPGIVEIQKQTINPLPVPLKYTHIFHHWRAVKRPASPSAPFPALGGFCPWEWSPWKTYKWRGAW